MLKLRLKKKGKKRQPSYRVVVMLSTSPRDGKVIKDLGFYNPITKELKLDVENIRYQLKNGVQPTKPVKNLLFKQNILQANAG
jgi:small subunit ribosomal protein S16